MEKIGGRERIWDGSRSFSGEGFFGVFFVLFSGVWKRRRINYNLPLGKSIFAKTEMGFRNLVFVRVTSKFI